MLSFTRLVARHTEFDGWGCGAGLRPAPHLLGGLEGQKAPSNPPHQNPCGGPLEYTRPAAEDSTISVGAIHTAQRGAKDTLMKELQSVACFMQQVERDVDRRTADPQPLALQRAARGAACWATQSTRLIGS